MARSTRKLLRGREGAARPLFSALAALVLITLGCGEQTKSTSTDAAGPDASTTEPPKSDARVAAPVDASVDENRQDDTTADSAAPDAGPEQTAPEGPLRWESSETTTDDGAIVIEKVVYLSDGLRVVGQVCRPGASSAFGSGPHPVQIMNHGGFSGLSSWNGGTCAQLARQGWVAAESSYRGEDDSEGEVEVCLGEVTDVLRLTDIVLAQAYADRARVLMSGTSHGGCITLRALQRGAPVQLAVDIFGPTDWATAYAGWQAALAKGTLLAGAYRGLVDALEKATGGTPTQVPEEYARRSPLSFVPALKQALPPLLVFQGVRDAYVPPEQACALARASEDFTSMHVATNGAVLTSAPTGCADAGLAWAPGPRPSASWPGQRYLLVYEDLGHNFEGVGTTFLLADLNAFVARLAP